MGTQAAGTALDGDDPAQQLMAGNRSIVVFQTIPPGNPLDWLLARGPVDHAVGDQPPAVPEYNDIAGVDFSGIVPVD